MSESELKELAEVEGMMEAEIIKSKLESFHIPALLKYESAGRIYGITMDGLGKVKILVSAEQLGRGKKIAPGSIVPSRQRNRNTGSETDEFAGKPPPLDERIEIVGNHTQGDISASGPPKHRSLLCPNNRVHRCRSNSTWILADRPVR